MKEGTGNQLVNVLTANVWVPHHMPHPHLTCECVRATHLPDACTAEQQRPLTVRYATAQAMLCYSLMVRYATASRCAMLQQGIQRQL